MSDPMCAAMMGTFLICWTPYTVVSLMTTANYPITAEVSTLPTMFAKLSCATNPVIYAFMSSKFREGLVSILPWSNRNQNRVGTRANDIELGEDSKFTPRPASDVREYRGDMTKQGVYIGNHAVALEVQSSVF